MNFGVAEAIAVASLVISPGVAVAGYYFRQLRNEMQELSDQVHGLRRDLAEINGRIIRIEEWRGSHDAHDDERFARVERMVRA